MTGSRITGWGTALPDKVITNDDLAATLDTSDEWIRERTGISERRIGGSTTMLAIECGQKALARSGVDPASVDLLIVATTTADQLMPSCAAKVQDALGLDCGAVDINAACSGFVYALVQANAMIISGYKTVLVIGSDTLSNWIDWEDRGTAILFGDGAGAVVLQAADEPHLLANDLGSDGAASAILHIDHNDTMKMDGREVFRRAVRAVVHSSRVVLERAGLTPDDIDWVIPHQANVRILESACEKVGIPIEKSLQVLAHTGNTSAGSIPLALVAGIEDGRVQPGDLLLMVGFGAGMTWASAIVRWDPND